MRTELRPAAAVLRYLIAGRSMEVWLVQVERDDPAAGTLASRLAGASYGDVVDVTPTEVRAAGARVVADERAGRMPPAWLRSVAEL